MTTLYSAESENPEDEDIGAYFVTKAADVVAHEVLERQEEAEAKKCTLIASFGEYIENRWYPTLIIISRYIDIQAFHILLHYCLMLCLQAIMESKLLGMD